MAAMRGRSIWLTHRRRRQTQSWRAMWRVEVMIEMELNELRPRISVMGVGGAGGNAIANMIRNGVAGVVFIAANTDAQALRDSPADHILQLGRNTTGGLGAGSRAEIGRIAA